MQHCSYDTLTTLTHLLAFLNNQVSDANLISLKGDLQVPKYNLDELEVTTNGKRKILPMRPLSEVESNSLNAVLGSNPCPFQSQAPLLVSKSNNGMMNFYFRRKHDLCYVTPGFEPRKAEFIVHFAPIMSFRKCWVLLYIESRN